MATTLVALAVAVACLGGVPLLLDSGSWQYGRPRLAVWLWVAAFAVGAAAFVFAVASWLMPIPFWQRPGCSGCGAAVAFGAGMLGLAVLVGVIAVLVAGVEKVARANQDSHADLLVLSAAAQPLASGLTDVPIGIVGATAPVAFSHRVCGRHIVISSGLVEALTAAELDSVIAHEHAHLAGHHHRLVQLAIVNAWCFPRWYGASTFQSQIHLLIELIADDYAARSCGTTAAAAALDTLGLATSEPTAEIRARRLRAQPVIVTAGSVGDLREGLARS